MKLLRCFLAILLSLAVLSTAELKNGRISSELLIDGKETAHATGWIDSTELYFQSDFRATGILRKPKFTQTKDDNKISCGMFDFEGKAPDIVFVHEETLPLGFLQNCKLTDLANYFHSMGAKAVVIPYSVCAFGEQDCKYVLDNSTVDELMVKPDGMSDISNVIKIIEDASRSAARIPVIILSKTKSKSINTELAEKGSLTFDFRFNLAEDDLRLQFVDSIMYSVGGSVPPFLTKEFGNDFLPLIRSVRGRFEPFVSYTMKNHECEDDTCDNCVGSYCRNPIFGATGKDLIYEEAYRQSILQKAAKQEEFLQFFTYIEAFSEKCAFPSASSLDTCVAEENLQDFVTLSVEKDDSKTFELFTATSASVGYKVFPPRSILLLNDKIIYDPLKKSGVSLNDLKEPICHALFSKSADAETVKEIQAMCNTESTSESNFVMLAAAAVMVFMCVIAFAYLMFPSQHVQKVLVFEDIPEKNVSHNPAQENEVRKVAIA